MSDDVSSLAFQASQNKYSANEAPSPRITISAVDAFNYAAWQNAIPLLHGLSIENLSGAELSGIAVELVATPPFIKSKRWIVDRIASGEVFPLQHVDVEIDPEYLDRLDEAVRGVLTIRLAQQERLLAETTHTLRILARDEWGGMASMAELLPAFVTPNDPALARLLKEASGLLGTHGYSVALDGYQSRDPGRAYMLAAAVWSAITGRSLTYANPPRSFEQVGQKTRRAGVVLGDALATCLDSSLLFASTLEAIGLNPILVMMNGHCFVGVWLVDKTLKRLIESDCSELRKAIAAKELTVFETTLVTNRPPARFPDAIRLAEASLSEEKEAAFVAAIDVTRARMAGIRPLASLGERSAKTLSEGDAGPLPLPKAPGFGAAPILETEERPRTAVGRIERWQRKLLDLTLRNRLLNFKPTKSTVIVLCPNVARLEDRLADNARMRLVSLDEIDSVADRDPEFHKRQTQKDLHWEFAQQAFARDELASPLKKGELETRLTDLYRKARNDLTEGGSNTLFLAVGFLKWKANPTDEQTYRAPLLLVPVKLGRRSAASPFYLTNHEDDVRFNATLLQLLKKDFDCDLSIFESDLPTDDSGVDVPLVFERVRQKVRDIPGFEVVEETAIATFSFAKYLMWKDLVDRAGHLERNRVVRHLIQDPDKPFRSGNAGSMPQPRELDFRYSPAEIVHPLPADSSQLAAVMAASEGHDLIIVGPPGTGKSQTIANLIAQCLAVGKTVLFVAEKTAALDVVYRRLNAHGLGDCCIELHSNKAERRRFLEQLESSWKYRVPQDASEWLTVSDRLRIQRDQLNAYVAAVHFEHPNGWTAYRAMGHCVRGRDVAAPRLSWPANVTHDKKAYDTLVKTVSDLVLTHGALPPGAALTRVEAADWSMAWETALLESCRILKEKAEAFAPALEQFQTAVGLRPSAGVSIEQLGKLDRLAQAIVKLAGKDLSILFEKQFAQFPAAIAELRELCRRHQAAMGSMSATYALDQIDAIPLDDLDRRWREAGASLWPLSWFGKRKVTRLLQSYATHGIAHPAVDLPALRELRALRTQFAANPLATLSSHWKGPETDVDAVEASVNAASEMRAAIFDVGQSSQVINDIARAIRPALRMAAATHALHVMAKEHVRYTKDFREAWRQYTEAAKHTPVSRKSQSILADAVAQADRVLANRTLLNRWTAWMNVRRRATNLGLVPFIEAIEMNRLSAKDASFQFELAYARWWIETIIDRSEPLRKFQRVQHEHAIEEFRRLDELARNLAAPWARQSILHGLPAIDQVPRKSELGSLRHQIGLKRPSKSIREVIGSMPETFARLAPCLLMSPLSIAQYLPVGQSLFDVVVFDEASQIATWDAIGAIARGKQTIIVGDPRQLPPTNFFGRAEGDEEDDIEAHEKDLESILDEAQASGLPTLQLNWHYRSRHESLIAFSNWNYYGNQLVTFPAAESIDRGVSLRIVADGLYDRGKSRTNRKEAEAVVSDIVTRMKRCLAKPEENRLTYGIVTFNIQQQTLLQDLLDRARRECPELEWFFSDERIEPTAVKNLENVQGDERDVMLFSITFGFDVSGKFPVDFGALNREGGERRLNVAVTRARWELVVYASFQPDQLRAERSSARGVRDLKAFLEYADKGPVAIAARTDGSVGEYESPLEEAIAKALIERGWRVDPQVGVSGFRVDLGVVHPDRPGTYLAGVECDGATYHRSAVARDRDKIRQQVLENLGWKIVRVWSPDWWYDPATALERVHAALGEELRRSRSGTNPGELASDLTEPKEIRELPSIELAATTAKTLPTDGAFCAGQVEAVEREAPRPELIARQEPAPVRVVYCRAELADFSSQQSRFFDADYTAELRRMATAVLEAESPIREDVLVQRVARANGIARIGANIKRRVLEVLPKVTVTEERTGRFLWASESPPGSVAFRFPAVGQERRSLDEIALAELVGLIRDRPDLAASDDPALALAREIGLARLARSARDRLEEALDAAANNAMS